MKMLCMRKIDLKISVRVIFDHEFEFIIANNPIDFKNVQIKFSWKFQNVQPKIAQNFSLCHGLGLIPGWNFQMRI